MQMNFSIERNPGEPLLLLPGLICDSSVFADQLSAFSAAVPTAHYGDATTLSAMAARVLAGAPRCFALLGHSMGARVALEVVRQAPERVTRLALVSTGVHSPREGEAAGRYALRDLGRAEGMTALVDAWLPPMVAPANAADHILMSRLRAMCVAAGLSRFEREIEALLTRPEVESFLPRIDCPVLIACGGEDRWSPPVQHQAMAAAIPRARLVIVPEAGHMLPAEKPGELNAAIGDWLGEHVALREFKRRRDG